MRLDIIKIVILCIVTIAMENEDCDSFDHVYPTSNAIEVDEFSSPDNMIQWLADKATEYGPWPSMYEHMRDKTIRYAAEKVAQKELLQAAYTNRVIPYESGEVECLSLPKYKDEVLHPLNEFVKTCGDNEINVAAVSQYFQNETNYPKMLNLFNQIMKKIILKENFVIKPGDQAFGLGVMMCEYNSHKDTWKIAYPSIVNSKNIHYVNKEFFRQGEKFNMTDDDIIYDLFYYVLPYITSKMKKTWIIENLIKSEITSYGTETPFEIKMAINYGKVVAIASKGFADTEAKTPHFIWRRDGEVRFFDEDVESQEKTSATKGGTVLIHDIRDAEISHLNGKTGRLDKQDGNKCVVTAKDESKKWARYTLHERNVFYIGQDVFVKENEKWVLGTITGFKKQDIMIRKKGKCLAFEYNIAIVKQFIEGQKVMVTISGTEQWAGIVESVSPLRVSTESGDTVEVPAEWRIEQKLSPNAQELWKMLQERIPTNAMWQEIIAAAEQFFQSKQVRLGRFDIFVPKVNEWWINEAEFPRAGQPFWFPEIERNLLNIYLNYLINSTFNDPEKFVMAAEDKTTGYKLPPAEFSTTKWKNYKTSNPPDVQAYHFE